MTFPDPLFRRPVDFDEFWATTIRELDEVPPAVGRGFVRADGGVTHEWLVVDSLGGVRVHGYVLRWDDGTPRPLVIHSHGYGTGVTPMWNWARAGLNVVGIDIRGQGESRDALPFLSAGGWILTGIETPESHVLRGAVCDVIRTVRVARETLGASVTRTILRGRSFAGGLVLMAQALDPVADLLVVASPTFGWAEGRLLLAEAGSAAELDRYLRRLPTHGAEDVMVVLRYFDTVNFAGRVRCPTLVGLGDVDIVVPPQTVLAIAARLGGPYEVMRFPVGHTELPEERAWQAFERRWIELAVNGVPRSFGVETARAGQP